MGAAIALLNESGRWLVTQLGRMSMELFILAGIVLVVLYVLRVKTPALRHLFWGLLLAKPVVTLLVASPLLLYGFLWPTTPEVFYTPVPAPVQMESAPFEPPVPTAVVPEAPPLESPRPESPPFWRQIDRYGLISALWALVASLFGLRLLLGCAYVSFLRSTAITQRTGPLADLVAEAERPLRMRRRVRIATTRVAHGPVLAGIFRPVILLPEHMAAALSPKQMKLVITHELAHARRWDNLVLLIQRLAEMFFFFHPVVWFCGWMMRREAEAACDDMVVSAYGDTDGAGAAAYADSLTRVAEMKCGITHRLLVNTFAAAESNFKRRIRRILSGRRTRMTLWLSMATGAALVLIGVFGLPTVSSTSKEPLSSQPASATPMLTETTTEWREDFENYTSGTGGWPDTWIADGNASNHDVCYVDGSTFNDSHGNTLRLHGDTPAWSPLAYFVTTMNMPFQIAFDVYLESPDPNCTCVVGLREKPDWTSPGVLLFDAPLSSEVKGLEPVADGGVVSQGQSTGQLHLEQAQWYHVELTLQGNQGRQMLAVTLSTGTNVQGPVRLSTDTILVKDMPYLQIEVRSGTAWFDNVSMAPVTPAQAEPFRSGPIIIAPLVGHLDEKTKAEWQSQGFTSDASIFEKLQDVTLESIRKRLDSASLKQIALRKMAHGRIAIDLPPGKEGERVAKIATQPGQVCFCSAASKEETLAVLTNAEKDSRFQGRIGSFMDSKTQKGYVSVAADQRDAARKVLDELKSILPEKKSFFLGSRQDPNALYLIDFSTAMTNAEVRSAIAAPDDNDPGRSVILMTLSDEGAQRFGELTQSLVGKSLAVLVDSEIQMVPTVRDRITNRIQVSGNYTPEEAADLAARISGPRYLVPLIVLSDPTGTPGTPKSTDAENAPVTLEEHYYDQVDESIFDRLRKQLLPVYDPNTGKDLSRVVYEKDTGRLTVCNLPDHLAMVEVLLSHLGSSKNEPAQPVYDEKNAQGGEVVDGLQAVLKTEKEHWAAGETPQFTADLHNVGTGTLGIDDPPVGVVIEYDGVQYTVNNAGMMSAPGLFSRGVHGLEGDLGTDLIDSEKRPLTLTPGKHTVRVAFHLHPPQGAEGAPALVFSNPITIEIGGVAVPDSTATSPSLPRGALPDLNQPTEGVPAGFPDANHYNAFVEFRLYVAHGAVTKKGNPLPDNWDEKSFRPVLRGLLSSAREADAYAVGGTPLVMDGNTLAWAGKETPDPNCATLAASSSFMMRRDESVNQTISIPPEAGLPASIPNEAEMKVACQLINKDQIRLWLTMPQPTEGSPEDAIAWTNVAATAPHDTWQLMVIDLLNEKNDPQTPLLLCWKFRYGMEQDLKQSTLPATVGNVAISQSPAPDMTLVPQYSTEAKILSGSVEAIERFVNTLKPLGEARVTPENTRVFCVADKNGIQALLEVLEKQVPGLELLSAPRITMMSAEDKAKVEGNKAPETVESPSQPDPLQDVFSSSQNRVILKGSPPREFWQKNMGPYSASLVDFLQGEQYPGVIADMTTEYSSEPGVPEPVPTCSGIAVAVSLHKTDDPQIMDLRLYFNSKEREPKGFFESPVTLAMPFPLDECIGFVTENRDPKKKNLVLLTLEQVNPGGNV